MAPPGLLGARRFAGVWPNETCSSAVVRFRLASQDGRRAGRMFGRSRGVGRVPAGGEAYIQRIEGDVIGGGQGEIENGCVLADPLTVN
jgi:hypothetical protein